MRFNYIPPGTFMMGSPPDEKGRDKDETLHQVTLTQGYYMQTTEVTVGQWRAFFKATGFKTRAETNGGTWIWNGTQWEKMAGFYWDNPSYAQTDDHPVKCVSWYDVQAFVKWLSEKEKKSYRLPTEAQWEYACRAGTTTAFAGGDISELGCGYNAALHGMGVYCGNSGWRTHPVAQKRPNAWGLYDMHGNVWEWCLDWKGPYPAGHVVDPVGAEKGTARVARGGSWDDRARRCRSAFSGRLAPNGRSHRLGFRLTLVP
jgi:formylglycine-generating enzyme required for sulfatase activity